MSGTSGAPESKPGVEDGAPAFDPRPALRRLTHKPGVYRMIGADGEILYVGKARDLKRRVASYFRAGIPGGKTGAMVRQVQGLEVTVTRNEAEALILENNLIKAHRPRFNVLLRDDKSYPYILLSSEHDYPRLSFYRGSRKVPGRLFGPFPSAGAVRETLNTLQKLFRIRNCEDSYFAHRSRPCLQHQIRRCSAPCVGLISREDYAADVAHALHFVEGRSREVIEELQRRMERAAGELAFEEAARYRDQIGRLKKIQQQGGDVADRRDLDIVAGAQRGGRYCVAVMFYRGGRHLGSRTWFPRAVPGTDLPEVVEAFLSQYYAHRPPPHEILTDQPLEDDGRVLCAALSEKAGRQVRIRHRVRGDRARWLEMTRANAEQALDLEIAGRAGLRAQLAELGGALELDHAPERLECFDVSHTMGESAVASCVVFGAEGPQKQEYRRFNITGVEPGDDYGAMAQALKRRYTRIRKGEAPVPDVLFVDGGKGQLAVAAEVLAELDMDGVDIVAVAKGPSRKPGMEQLFLVGRERPLILPRDSAALHLIQQIRDEAHRFAIAGHRGQRSKARQRSVLEDIPGLGPVRRRELLKEYGGLKGISAAGIDDLARVPGISRSLASRIWNHLHPEG